MGVGSGVPKVFFQGHSVYPEKNLPISYLRALSQAINVLKAGQKNEV